MRILILFFLLLLGPMMIKAQLRSFYRLDAGIQQQVRTQSQHFAFEGFSGGLHAGLAVGQRLEIQAGLRLAQREALRETEFETRVWNGGTLTTTGGTSIGLTLVRGTWLDIPLRLRYFIFQQAQFRIYGQAGGSWHFSPQQNLPFIQPGNFPSFIDEPITEYLSVHAGVGVQVPMGKKFQAFIESGVESTPLVEGFGIKSNVGVAFYPGR
ncbi:MAG: hypothetical protein AAF206_00575 [Bacteroidota bacterium]